MNALYISLIIASVILLISAFIYYFTFFYPTVDVNKVLKDCSENFKYKETYENIPKVIFITYKDKKILKKLKNKWQKLNPEYKIEIYDNKDCEKYLYEKFSSEHMEIFKKIKHGPIKGDYFRAHRMKEGGIYVDADVSPFEVDPYSNMFIIPYSRFKHLTNPTLIIAPPNHPFILQTIKAYKIIVKKIKYGYWKWSIVTITAQLNKINVHKIPKILQEKRPIAKNKYSVFVYDVNNGKKVFNNRVQDYDYVKHEFKHSKQF